MKRLQFVFILFLLLTACKKLDSEQVFLKNSCEDCKGDVENYLLSLKGVYYANYDFENETLIFHFDREDSRLEAEDWLREQGFIQSPDSSYNFYPECCPVKDSTAADGE